MGAVIPTIVTVASAFLAGVTVAVVSIAALIFCFGRHTVRLTVLLWLATALACGLAFHAYWTWSVWVFASTIGLCITHLAGACFFQGVINYEADPRN